MPGNVSVAKYQTLLFAITENSHHNYTINVLARQSTCKSNGPTSVPVAEVFQIIHG